ncbi:MOSC domain-containing protein [Schlesneria paludicola]|uniref:MOSC domain-containing protein n=1 Tax=Schlesneria paludicola TaxID=360056 RepID=UPI00029AA399|nr:MOSC domain-containing protein [Schlesneria paludicola]
MPVETLTSLLNTLPQQGRLRWIGVRPARLTPVQSVEKAILFVGRGIEGDHRFGGRIGSKRQVTLIQYEHLQAVASLLHRDDVAPELARRNLVISGLNLLALKGKQFRIGEVCLEYSGPCEPCSRMESVLGPGGYNAMRGHGGITAKVIVGGTIHVGDAMRAIPSPQSQSSPR